MSVSRSAAPAVQFLLVANPEILLSSGQTRKLQQAIGGAGSRLGALPGRRDRMTLLRELFGDTGQPSASGGGGVNANINANSSSLLASLAGAGLGLQVQLRSQAEMNGAAVAYAPRGPGGAARIYLSAAVLESGISSEQISLLLLKAAGQHIDARLNGERDALGDEGLAFASRISGRKLTAAEQTLLSREARGGVVSINGSSVVVETQSSSSIPTSQPLAPNQAPSLSATTTAASVSEAEGLATQAAPVTLFSNVTVSTGGSGEAGQTITQLRLSLTGLRDGASERLWLDGTAIALGGNASGSTAGSQIPGGISYSLTLSSDADGSSTAQLSLSSSAGLSGSATAALIQALAYQNANSDNPTAGTRSITITGLSDSGGTANGGADSAAINITSTITVIAVNDAPQLGRLSAISLIDTAAQDSFAASGGGLLASDPEGSSLSYGLEGAVASSASFDGLSYDLSRTGSYGTLYLNSSSGVYRFQPRSDWQLNALSASGSESFNLTVSDGSLTSSTALLVSFSGSSEAPEQYVLVDDGSPVLNADAQALWEQALTNASRELSELLRDPNRDALLADVFGRAGTDPAAFEANKQALLQVLSGPGLQIDVDLRSNAELNGAAAAYAAVGHTGKERLYVNGDLINSGQLDLTLLTSALLEEYGHALDTRLNAGVDSPGDEGQLFASQVTGVTLTAEQRAVIEAENDSATLTIEGVQVAVEEAEFVGTPSADNITGGATSDFLFGGSGNDTISSGTGNDIVIGGKGADILSGDGDSLTSGINGYIFYAGDSAPSLGGSGTAGTITGYDIITDYLQGSSTGTVDPIRIFGTNFAITSIAAALASGTTTGLDYGTTGVKVKGFSISNGRATFTGGSGTTNSNLTAFTNQGQLAAIIEFLGANSIGGAGRSIGFISGTTTAGSLFTGSAAGVWSFIYTQGDASAGLSNSTLIAFQPGGTGYTQLGQLVTTASNNPNRYFLDSTAVLSTPTLTASAGVTGGVTGTEVQTAGLFTVSGLTAGEYVYFSYRNTSTNAEIYKSVLVGSGATSASAPALTSGEVSLLGDGNIAIAVNRVSFTTTGTIGADASDYATSSFTLDTTSPSFTSGISTSANENVSAGSAIYTAAATDNASLTYSISGTDSASFAINSSSGVVTINASPNFEAKSSFAFTVTATDEAGNATARNVTLSINDVAEAPVFSSGGTASFAENATGTVYSAAATDPEGSTVTLSMSGTDAALFNFNKSTGAVTFKNVPNFETPLDAGGDNIYDITIRASDGSLTTDQAVVITVTNVNEAPTLASIPASFTVTEDVAGNLAFTGTPFADVDSSNLTVTLSIADGTITGNAGTGITIGGTAIARTFSGTAAALNTYFTTAGNITYTSALDNTSARTLTVQVSDGSLSASTTSSVSITAVNDTPTLTSIPASFSVTEDVAGNLAFTGAPFADVDSSNLTVTLSIDDGTITGNAGTGITIGGSATARTFTGTAAALNTYFTTAGNITYTSALDNTSARTLTVQVSDGSLSASTTSSVSITAVNDTPTLTSIPASFSVTEDVAGNLAFTGSPFADVDSSSLTVTLSIADGTITGNAGTGITIGGSATARTFSGTAAALNTYFTTAGNITYTSALNNTSARTLTVQVSDGSLSASTTSSVSITAVNDAPLINDASTAILKTAAAGSTVFNVNEANSGNDTDLDGTALTYSLTSDPTGGGFAINASTGEITIADPARINYAGGPSSFNLQVQASDGTLSDTATVTVSLNATNQLGTANADTLTGTAADDYLDGLAGNDSLDGGAGNDLLEGDTGADTMTGGSGRDSFFNPTGASTITISGSGTGGSITGFDVITDFTLINTGTGGESLRVTPSGTSAKIITSGFDGSDSSLFFANGNKVKGHTVSPSGIAQFDDAGTFANAIALTTAGDVAAVVQYLSLNDLGDAGSTLAFTASINSTSRTFVYTQTTIDKGSTGGFGLVELLGQTATSLTTDRSSTTAGALLISNDLAPVADVPLSFNLQEDVAGSLRFSGTSPFADVDSNLTITLTVGSGTITGTAASGITIGGTATARTFNGTVANLNTYFTTAGNITYQGASNANGNVTLTVGVSDSTTSQSYASNIFLTPVNDAPTLTGIPASFTVSEDVPGNLTFTGTPFADVDSSNLTVTLSISDGTIAGIASSGITIGGTATARSFSGTAADLNAYFTTAGNITYTSALNNNAARSLSVQISDSSLNASTTATVNISAVNDAPTLTGIPASFTVSEDVPGNLTFTGTPFADVDSSSLTVTLSISDGSIAGIAGTGITIGGTATARTFSGSAADLNAYFTTAGNITYTSALNNNAARSLSVQISDSSLNAYTTATVNISAVNDAPTLTGIPESFTVSEDVPGNLTFTGTPFADVDSSSLTVTLSIADGSITGNAGTGITIGGGPTARTFSGTAAALNTYFTTAGNITYTSVQDNNTARNLTVAISDGAGGSNSTTATVNISAVNDAPTLTGIPASFTVSEDVPGNLTFTGTPFADVDSSNLTVTLSISDGSIAGIASSGITIGGTATARSFSGTAADLNAYFTTAGNITYTSALNTTAARSLSVQISDSSLSASTTATVNISPVNDAPTLDTSASPLLSSVSEDTSAPIAGSTVNSTLVADLVSGIADVDSGAVKGIAITAVNLQGGTLYYSGDAGVSWSVLGSVSESSALLLAADANTRLYYKPAANFNGSISDVFSFKAWDRTSGTVGTQVDASSSGGSTAFSTSSDSVSVTVTAGNDAPVLNANGVSVVGDVTREVGFDIANPRSAVAFMEAGRTNLSDVDSSSFSQVSLRIRASWLQNGADEKVLIKDGTTTVSTLALAITDASYSGSVSFSLGGVSYTATRGESTVDGNLYRNLSFSRSDNAAMTTAEAEALLDALAYTNSATNVLTSARRTFELTVSDAGGAVSNASDVVFTLGNGPRIDLDGNGAGYNNDSAYRLVSFSEGTLPGVKLADDGTAPGGINLQPLYSSATYSLVDSPIAGLSFQSNGSWSYNTAASGLSLAGGTSQTFTINYNWASGSQSGQHLFTITVSNTGSSESPVLVASSNRPLSSSSGASINGQLGPSVDRLGIGINTGLFVDSGHEFFVIAGATNHIANGVAVAEAQQGRLNLLSTPSTALGSMTGTHGSFTLGGVSYRYEFVLITGSLNRIFFTKNTGSGSGGTLTYAEAEALIDAYHYLNTSDKPTTNVNRTLNFGVFSEGLGNAPATATIQLVNVDDEASGTLTVSGVANEAGELSASLSAVVDADGSTTTAYRWQELNGDTWIDISGASSATFSIPADQSYVGKQVRVVATTTDSAGGTTTFEGAGQTIANVNDAPGGSVTISGTASQGQTLSVSNTLSDADGLGTISYQWQADGQAIDGATGASFTLTQAQVGKAITVTASYSDAQGTAEAVTSLATALVANVNDLPGGNVTISGTASEGQTLTASHTLSDADGLGTISYQWQADGEAIGGATGDSFTLTQAQVGKAITVTASYTDALGASESVNSSATAAVANVDTVAPVFSSGSTASIEENVAAGTLVYTAIASDSDFNAPATAGSITYSLSGSDASAFNINASSGAVTIKASPDHESKNSYSFSVVATDAAGNSASQAVSLSIGNRDELAPVFSSGASAPAIAENSGAGQVIYTAAASDLGDGSNGVVSYALKPANNDDAALLSINSSTGAVSLTGNPDFETKASYAFTVVATDAAGNSSERAVSLSITNRDEVAPSITSAASATALDENSGAGQVVYTATASDTADVSNGVSFSLKAGLDAAAFSINSSSGAVTLTGNPDFETKASYSFTVIATDAAGNSSEQLVSLAIHDVDDTAPTVAITAIGGANSNVSAQSGDNNVVGSAEASRTVSVFLGQTLLGTTTADASGNFSYSLSTDNLAAIGQGSGKAITASQTDAAGNTGSSAPFSFSVDTLVPNAPGLSLGSGVANGATALEATQPSGVVTVSGESGASLQVTFSRTANNITNTVVKTLTATGASQAVLLNATDLTTLGNGVINVSAIATDAAGNASSASTSSFTLDSAGPALTALSFGSHDGNLAIGESLTLVATLSEVVNVSGNTTLVLNNGASATYSGGTGSNQLSFTYTAAAGQSIAALSTAASTALRGTITDLAGNAAVASSFNNITPTNGPVAVDAIAPTLTTISYGSNDGNLSIGEAITLVVTGSEALNVTGSPSLSLSNGGTATYLSGSGSNQLVFRYIPGADQSSADLATASSNALITGLSGTITDQAGNAISASGFNGVNPSGTVVVDTGAPSVSSVAISSASGAQNNQLNAGDKLTITVSMSEAVIVNTTGGTPQLNLNVGGTPRSATYASGSGTTALLFTYTIQAGDSDADGISIDPDSLTLNGGSIRDLAGNSAASLAHAAVSDNNSYLVNNSLPQLTASSFSANDGQLAAGEAINLLVDFDEAVQVSGIPSLLLNTGGTASYTTGSGTSRLSFRYTPASGESTADLAAAVSNAFNGVITDLAGNAIAASAFNGLDPSGSVAVDAIAPQITSLAVSSSSGGTLGPGAEITVTVAMSETVLVSGTPQLTINLGADLNRTAAYVSGSGTTSLVFSYTIQASDTGASSISIPANSLANVSGSTIRDAAGNNALLSHQAYTNGSYTVDIVAPTLLDLAFSSATGAQDGSLNAGDVVFITATMSEVVNVTGAPQLALEVGGNTRQAAYVSGSGSSTLLFSYTIEAGDTDSDGIAIAANSLTLTNGTIRDAVNNATLTHSAVDANPAYMVDTTAPEINSLAISSASGAENGRLNAGDVVSIGVSLSESVIVSGSPQLRLQIGNSSRTATYVSGSGSSQLLFSYTVQPGDTDADGISFAAGTLLLNGGSISDAAGNAAVLSTGAVADNGSYKVDTSAPEASFATTIGTNTGLTATIDSGGATRDNTLSFSGTASDAGVLSKVEIYSGSTYLGDATLDSNAGTWSYTTPGSPSALADGSHSFTARVTDQAGNVFITSAVNARIDTTAPGRPSIAFAIDDVVPGTANVLNGGTTNDNTPTLRISLAGSGAVAGDTVQLLNGDTIVASATITSININDAFVQLTPTLANDGAYSFTARLVDAVGNVSQSSTAFSLTIDRLAPNAPSLALSADTGSSAVDGISQTGTITVSGLETATTAWQYSSNGGVNWFRGSGSSFTLANGSYAAGSVQVRQADLAGNLSSVATNASAIRIDNTAPTIAISASKPSLGLVGGSPDTATITFVLSESVPDFDLSDVAVSLTGGVADGTLTNLQGSGTLYTATFTPVAALNKAVVLSIASARFTDLAGNANSDGSDANNAVAITVDTRTPDPSTLPYITSVTLVSDSGTAGDWITRTLNPSISGTLSQALDVNQVLRISQDNGSTWQTVETTTTTVDGVSTTRFSLATTITASSTLIGRVEALVNGELNLGNSWSRYLTIDTSTFTGSLSLLEYSGNLSNGSAAGTDNSFDLSLPNAEPGATISYQRWNGSGWDTLSGASQSNLADGSYRYRAVATDAAGNTATSTELSVAVDRSAPNAPTLSLNNGVTEPLSRAQLIASNGAILVSSAEAGATITLTLTSDAQGSSPVVKTFTSSGSTQSVVFSSSDAAVLGDGTLTANATISDPAGNSSSAVPLSFSYVAQPITILGDLSISRSQNGTEAGPTPSLFTVTRTGDLSAATTVNYRLSGTAIAGTDYVAPSLDANGIGTISFAAGASSATLSIATIDNANFDSGSRTLTALLVKPDAYNLVTTGSSASATLVDNDQPAAPILPSITFNDLSVVEGSNGNWTASLSLSLSQASTDVVSVDYIFSDGPGADGASGAGVDYTGIPGTASFSPNTLRQTISFVINGDSIQENNENFVINFSNPVNATLTNKTSATITIANDDTSGPIDPSLGVTLNLSSPGTLTGTDLNDSLGGSSGSDSILGGLGNDTIDGNGSGDRLTGGDGADRFIYSNFGNSTSAAFDFITDFNPSTQSDRILVSAGSLPSKLWNVGSISSTVASSLTAAITSASNDADRITAGSQALAEGEALVFTWGTSISNRSSYLLVNSSGDDLLIRTNSLGLSTLGPMDVNAIFGTI